MCEGQEALNTHHKTYRNLGNELPDDLIVLCREDHAKFHDVLANPETLSDHPKVEDDDITKLVPGAVLVENPLQVEEVPNDLKRDGPPVRITVTIRADSSLFDRYQLRVKWAWRIFTSYTGNDRFSIIVYDSGGSRFKLNFPNITTDYCDELLAQLTNVINVPNDIDVQPLLL